MADEQAETPEHQAKVIIDPSHPEAGKGGVVPPAENRFPPGVSPNPGGRPKGYDPRAVLRRKLAANHNEFGEGKLAEEIADRAMELADLIASGDKEGAEIAAKAFDAQLRIIHEVSGKPQEFVEHTGSQARTVVIHAPTPGSVPPALPEGA